MLDMCSPCWTTWIGIPSLALLRPSIEQLAEGRIILAHAARIPPMILHQFYLNCLAHASYLVGDEQTRTAAVVDPQRDVDQYLAFAAEHRLQIKHVLLTHLHADFIAGHLELRDRVGATIYLGAKAEAEYAFTRLADGDQVEFGRVRLKALETPGHTPESISIAVYDLDENAEQ